LKLLIINQYSELNKTIYILGAGFLFPGSVDSTVALYSRLGLYEVESQSNYLRYFNHACSQSHNLAAVLTYNRNVFSSRKTEAKKRCSKRSSKQPRNKLSDQDELAEDIVENLEIASDRLREIINQLKK